MAMSRTQLLAVVGLLSAICILLIFISLPSGEDDNKDYMEENEAGAGDYAFDKLGDLTWRDVWPDENNPITVTHSKYGSFTMFKNTVPHARKLHMEITMITILEMQYLPLFRLLLSRMEYPILVICYVEEQNAGYQILEIKALMQRWVYDNRRINMRIHIVIGKTKAYPVNYLTNLAWDMVTSDWVLLWKLPLLPSMKTDMYLRKVIAHNENLENVAYVISSFNSVCYWNPFDIPTKDFFMDDMDIFANMDIDNPTREISYVTEVRNHCKILGPKQLGSPTDYERYYQQFLVTEFVGYPITSPLYWGYQPDAFLVKADSPRPCNNFPDPDDANSAYLIQLFVHNYALFVLPHPIFGHEVVHTPAVTKEDHRALSPDSFESVLCHFRDDMLDVFSLVDPICTITSTDPSRDALSLPCCHAYTIVEKLPRTTNPNWAHLSRQL